MEFNSVSNIKNKSENSSRIPYIIKLAEEGTLYMSRFISIPILNNAPSLCLSFRISKKELFTRSLI